ncbi:outer membrane protein transport protein [Flavobacterium sp. CBA20B-1]|uniref:OmpP1/FadL family transporter n=1 Tax=unclassified Flavobacterium TaxID=196869 RepID=UPI00222414E2|nr:MULTISPECIES: outer membrane protein transport protein [unclassified Flavobacterium]WCM43171.1 outer membrane protein transport protein [Flavobacterium sp. CBA20B-1]
MKKIYLPLLAICGIMQTQAQEFNPNDAVRIGTQQVNGSARYNAMGGAFGALGGDISTMQINPAGTALFNYNNFSFTGNLQLQRNESIFNGNSSKAKENDLNLSNFGAVFVIDSKNQEKALKKVTIGLGYHSNARFNDRTFSSGITNQSVTNYFLDHANNGFNGGSVPLDLVQTMENESITDLYDYLNTIPNGFSAQQAMLAYQGYLINDTGTGYTLNGAGSSFYQENETFTTGFNNQLTANVAFDIDKKLYVGANLNLHFVDYLTSSAIYEENRAAITDGYKELLFRNDVYTYGSGFSFNIGGIYKATEAFRIGASYQSPTWMRLQDEFSQSLQTSIATGGSFQLYNIDPAITTLYNKYSVKNPGAFTGSLAYVFGTKGLLSMDYIRKDYSTIEYSADDANYDLTNDFYRNNLQATNEFRIGGEYRLDRVSLRAGYRFASSPYKNKTIMDDLTSYSGGIGYSFGASRIDLGYQFWQQDAQQRMISSGTNGLANIQSKNHNISLSYTASF